MDVNKDDLLGKGVFIDKFNTVHVLGYDNNKGRRIMIPACFKKDLGINPTSRGTYHRYFIDNDVLHHVIKWDDGKWDDGNAIIITDGDKWFWFVEGDIVTDAFFVLDTFMKPKRTVLMKTRTLARDVLGEYFNDPIDTLEQIVQQWIFERERSDIIDVRRYDNTDDILITYW